MTLFLEAKWNPSTNKQAVMRSVFHTAIKRANKTLVLALLDVEKCMFNRPQLDGATAMLQVSLLSLSLCVCVYVCVYTDGLDVIRCDVM